MDHLPHFGGSERVRVPYLDGPMYDGGDFFAYPERRGWDMTRLKQMLPPDYLPEEFPAFLQAWTFFGLLHRVLAPLNLNPAYDPNHFIERGDGGARYVTTKELPRYIIRWHALESKSTDREKFQRSQYIKPCLELLANLSPGYYTNSSTTRPKALERWPLPPEVLLSCRMLGDTLQWAAFKITGWKFNLDWGISPLLIEHMWTAGWCPSATATLYKGQQLQNLYCASTLGPPTVLRDHQNYDCRESLCRWEQVDERTYATQHHPPCTDCAFLGPDEQELRHIIQGGGVPVVSFAGERDSLKVLALKAQPNTIYVALSHVCRCSSRLISTRRRLTLG